MKKNMERIFFHKKLKKKEIKKLEEELGVKIKEEKNFLLVEGDALSEYVASKVLKAALYFPLKTAMLLKEEDYMLEEINIKNYLRKASSKRLREIRGRLIGKEGKVLKTIEQLSNCAINLYNNTVIVIGKTEDVDVARDAIIALIRGSKYSNIYARLEKLGKRFFPEDFGLK